MTREAHIALEQREQSHKMEKRTVRESSWMFCEVVRRFSEGPVPILKVGFGSGDEQTEWPGHKKR